MDRCPHCGRTLRPDAESCPYCGSDFETGWNPDADYYGFELPSDDEVPPPREPSPTGHGINWDMVVGIGAIFLAGVFFVAVPRSRALEEPTNLVVIGMLVLSFWFFIAKTGSRSWTEPR